MVNTEYKIAYSEVLEILRYISKEELIKIPSDMIEIFKTNASKENKFVYDKNKTLQEQNVSETTRTIIAILYRDYWATEIQKNEIISDQNNERELNKKEVQSLVEIKNDKWYKKVIKFFENLLKL